MGILKLLFSMDCLKWNISIITRTEFIKFRGLVVFCVFLKLIFIGKWVQHC